MIARFIVLIGIVSLGSELPICAVFKCIKTCNNKFIRKNKQIISSDKKPVVHKKSRKTYNLPKVVALIGTINLIIR